eukprot:TRINITY_DN14260_c0_g1_i1.p1 TRINITY_DN14260_c0_g1~~TRINITY_DN14260_c0_g1_i1.p1  ORF type:complete len:159 (+),score=17.15 TRINITY_DN14260_c0_g1_i1:40-516(+)
MESYLPEPFIEWPRLFYLFRTQERVKLVDDLSEDKIVHKLLTCLKNENDTSLKTNLLIFLQENSSFLLDGTRIETVWISLNSIFKDCLNDRSPESYVILSQIIITLTSILIEHSAIHSNTEKYEKFVDMLFDIIGNVNTSIDKTLRIIVWFDIDLMYL